MAPNRSFARSPLLGVFLAIAVLVGGCAVEPVSLVYENRNLIDLTTKLLADGRIPKTPDWREHVVTADKRGKFEERMFADDDPCRGDLDNAGFGHCQMNRVITALETALADHARLSPEAENRPPFRLLLFIHGGLVSETAAVKRAKEHLPLMRADGVYPLFLNWHTGPFNTYANQVTFVRNGTRIDSGTTPEVERIVQTAATPTA